MAPNWETFDRQTDRLGTEAEVITVKWKYIVQYECQFVRLKEMSDVGMGGTF